MDARATLRRGQGRGRRRQLREGGQAATSASKAAPPARCWRSRRRSSAPTCSGRAARRRRRCRRSSASSSCIRPARRSTTRSTCRAWSTSTTTSACSAACASQDLSERDQQASRDSYQSFRQLVEQFPQSTYAEDARAAHELHRQLAGRLRSARRALLLPPRRLRRRGQPGAAGGAGVPAVALDRGGARHHGAELRPPRPDRAARRRRPRAEDELPEHARSTPTASAASKTPWWQLW